MSLFTEELLKKTGSAYKLVLLAAKRALEINEGSPPLVEIDPKRKPAIIALKEIEQGKVSLRPKKK